MTPAERLLIQAEIDADEHELELRGQAPRAAVRDVTYRMAALDPAAARSAWERFTELAVALAAHGELDVADVAGAVARLVAAMQFAEYGPNRLGALGLRLGDT